MKSYKLEVKNSDLILDNKPFKLRSGTIHYFRVHPDSWYDRLAKLKACGLNTVETYIAWNIHEPTEGNFVFDGGADFIRFIEIATELGLYVIVRPGPFICAEWEMGGFPAWISKVENISLRHFNKPYLEKVDAYFDKIIPMLVPYLSTNGGNIIAMQVENEHGGYKEPDSPYMQYLKDGLIKRGVDVLLFTSDGTWDNCLADGAIPDILMTANFGSRYKECFAKVDALRPNSPKICMEFWNGWFDFWGDPHHTRETQSIIDELEGIIKDNGHFNIYMFCGGTNFGFMNGSNYNESFYSITTSYDYGATLTEDGSITDMYTQIRELLKKYDGVNPPPVPENSKKSAYGKVSLSRKISLFDAPEKFGKELKSENPLTMEDCDDYYGYILYRTDVSGYEGILDIGTPHDRAMVYGDGKYLGVIERGGVCDEINIKDISNLSILVENTGRINYGPKILEKKGLVEKVKIGEKEVKNFIMNTIPMNDMYNLSKTDKALSGPAVYTAEFDADNVCDTFVNPIGFTKGIIEINGFNLGRYYKKGPQQTLYVPAGVLKKGTNKIAVFDLYQSENPVLEFVAEPVLDVLDAE